MNPVTQSKQELEASIRYCENAIASAKQTIESMAKYQEQTGREAALEREVGELKVQLSEREDKWDDAMNENRDLRMKLEELKTNMALMEDKIQGQYDDIVQLERDLTVKTSQAEAWKKEAREAKEGTPTMPVIPKDVAIAIFREGVQSGINDAVAELEGQSINIDESEYVGDFHVTFERDIDLDDHLDLDWMRDKVGQYNEEFVVDALKGLCANEKFECRIHGIDNIDLTKSND